MRKPPYISHYLVLKDLIAGVDVRIYSDTIVYLTSRIENIKMDLLKDGVQFIDDISKESKYSYYKPYILLPTKENIIIAEEVLIKYATSEVLDFLEVKQSV